MSVSEKKGGEPPIDLLEKLCPKERASTILVFFGKQGFSAQEVYFLSESCSVSEELL